MIEQVAEINWSPYYTWQVELDIVTRVLTVFRYRNDERLKRDDDEPSFGKVFACSANNPMNYPVVLLKILIQAKKEPRHSPENLTAGIIQIQNAFVRFQEDDATAPPRQ